MPLSTVCIVVQGHCGCAGQLKSFDPYYFIKSLPQLLSDHCRNVCCVLPRKSRSAPEHTLVLDLDETLVHCSTEQLKGYDFTFPVTAASADGKDVTATIYVRRRPYVEHFLQTVSKKVSFCSCASLCISVKLLMVTGRCSSK
eukprot:SAG31_NODE_3207_length_4553_cov_1.406376_3_plen_142_part_00